MQSGATLILKSRLLISSHVVSIVICRHSCFTLFNFPQPSLDSANALSNRLLRHDSLRNENIHQPLQRLHVLLRQQIVVHRDRNEVHEAAV